MTHIQLNRRANRLCKVGTQDEVDFERVSKHLSFIKRKYEANLSALQTYRSTDDDNTLVSSNDTRYSKNGSIGDVVAKPLPPDKGQTLIARIRHSMHVRRAQKSQTAAQDPKTSTDKDKQQQQQQLGTGNVALTDENELLWHGEITLGGQKIQVDFDTGSSDIILNQGSYKPGSSAAKANKTFQTGYGDGTTAKGQIYLDSIEIGGVEANGAAIGLADSRFLNAQEGDSGIAGMAFAPLVQLAGYAPFFDVLLRANVLSQPVFTFTLRKSNPTLFLGGIPDEVKQEPTYVDVDASRGFWQTDGSINGAPSKAIHDTGTTLIVAPTAYARALFQQLGLQTFTQDGTLYATLDPSASSMPNVTLTFGQFARQLSPDTLTFGQTNDGKRVLSIVGSEIGLDGIIFGDSWLQNVVAVFSREEQVSFTHW